MILVATSSMAESGESRRVLIPLCTLPFVVALAFEIFSPTGKTWKLISAFHEGVAVLWGVLGSIFFVVSLFPANESATLMLPFFAFCFVLVVLQVCVVYLARRLTFQDDAAGGMGISFVRAISVFYSAVLFLVMFK